jgi:hypothetical protein
MTDAPHAVSPAVWPEPLVESFDGTWPSLSSETSVADVEKWVVENKRVLIRTVTWNLCAKPPPSSSGICVNLLPKDRYVALALENGPPLTPVITEQVPRVHNWN